MNQLDAERIDEANMAEFMAKNPELVTENQAWFESDDDDVNWDEVEVSSDEEKKSATRPSNNDVEAGPSGD